VPDGERLQGLRARLASTENPDTLRRLAVDTSELALVAPENLLEAIGELTDRIHGKLDCLVPPKAPRKESRKPRPLAVKTDEVEDEPSPISIKAGRDPLLERLRAVHGEPRADVAPGLATRP
jgi:hypothetical protein